MTVGAALALLASAAAPVACPHVGNWVVVDTHARVLVLCETGSPTRTFGVHLGRGGVGKRQAGDEKVPLGTYELGLPRRSARFGTFIPIATWVTKNHVGRIEIR